MSYSFVSGYVQSSEIIRVVAQVDVLSEMEEPNSSLMKWVASENHWYAFHLDWYATRICVLLDPELQVIALGPDGKVNVGTTHGEFQEHVDNSKNGPISNGLIRDMHEISGTVYATGMGRQIYERSEMNNWFHIDKTVLQPPSTKEVTGFNSIDGISNENLYAVGMYGEIWHGSPNNWFKSESPTNVILNKVKVIDKKTVFICGQKGTILKGTANNWQVLDQTDLDDELWDMAWFNDELYVSGDESLYKLGKNNILAPIDLKSNKDLTFRYLHSSDGIILSTGPKSVIISRDGKAWEDITP